MAPRFGFNKTLDLDCVEKLFGQEKINVVFLEALQWQIQSPII